MRRVLIVLVCGLAGCATTGGRFEDREAIEDVLSRANRGFEISDPELFADAFAEDAVYELTGKGPVFGYQRMKYEGREQIRTILTDRIERARNTDPRTLSYDPASLRRFNRNSDENIDRSLSRLSLRPWRIGGFDCVGPVRPFSWPPGD